MFLRSTERKKDGKTHRYFSVVENRRLPGARTVQRTVLYLGEINDHQQAAWRKTLEVFDEDEQQYCTMSLFPDDREVPADVLDSIQVKLSGLELRRPRLEPMANIVNRYPSATRPIVGSENEAGPKYRVKLVRCSTLTRISSTPRCGIRRIPSACRRGADSGIVRALYLGKTGSPFSLTRIAVFCGN